jgi:hypothetical protein
MYFSLWKTAEVSEKMRSVNLESSISGEYQTLAGHSGLPLEYLGCLTKVQKYDGSDCDKFENTLDRWREL